jgi:hypothetical protein
VQLVKDYVYKFEALWEEPGQCRVRVYHGEGLPTVFICTELPENRSGSIVTVVEWLAADTWQREGEPEPFVWIEHYPSEMTSDHIETFDEVTFARPSGPRFFSPQWRRMTREEVEGLIGQPLE